MRVFIVHAHPEPKSFNGAMTARAEEALTRAGHEVRISDLYRMEFNPVSGRHNFTTVKDPDFYRQQAEEIYANENGGYAPDIQAELEKVDWCDAMIFQFPLWWFSMPAILKGWVDRVFAMGRTYGGGRWHDKGVFVGRRAMCSVTAGGPASIYSETGLNGDIRQILFPINHGIFAFTGFTVVEPFLVHSPVRISAEDRAAHLDRYEQRVLGLMDAPVIRYPKLGDYDEKFQLKSGAR